MEVREGLMSEKDVKEAYAQRAEKQRQWWRGMTKSERAAHDRKQAAGIARYKRGRQS